MSKFFKYFFVSFVVGALFAILLNTACSTRHTEVTSTKTLSSNEPTTPAAVGANKTREVLQLTVPDSRLVRIDGVIQDMGDTVARILTLGQTVEPLYIELNSPGGDVLEGAMILSAIEAAHGPVYTICNKLCASMAAIIFEHGTYRYAVDRSFVMFHPASGGSQGELDKMVSRLKSVQRFVGKMEAYIAKRAGITFEQYKSLSGVELWLDAEDAVNAVFADKIVSVILPAEAPHATFAFGGTSKTNFIPGVSLDPLITPFNFTWGLK
jgi:ATP-dependent Clp protease protease subunit